MIKPLRDEVFVTVLDGDNEKRQSGIILVGNRVSSNTAIVKAVGPGFENPHGVVEAIPLKQGDKVFFPRGTGLLLEHDDEKFIMVKFGDIMGIIED